jgi:hypothetical protein
MTISRVYVWSGAVLLALNLAVPALAVIVLSENFNDDTDNDATDAPFVKADVDTSPTSFFVNNDGDSYWGIHDPVGTTDDYDDAVGTIVPIAGAIPAFTGFDGNYLVGEQLVDHVDAFDDLPLSLTWNNLNITGLIGLQFSGLFAHENPPGDVETADFLRISYRLNSDAGAFTNLLWFSRDVAQPDPEPLGVDADFDGNAEGGTPLTLAAQLFSVPIITNGTTHTTLDLRIQMAVDQHGDGAFALDNISVAVPEPAAFKFGGVVCTVVGLAWVGRLVVGKKVTTEAA